LYGNYTYDNRLYVLDQKTESISVVKSAEDNTTSLGSLDLSLNVSSKTLEAGEMFRVEYLFYNRYMDYDVTNVRAYLSINDEVKSSFTKSLLPALNAMRVKSYGVSNKDTNLTFYTDPAWGTKTNIEVEVLAEFNGTEIKIMNSTNITIKESPQIKVTTEFSSTNVTEGELVQCTVSIANLKKAPINNLSVYEVIPKGVSVLSGTYERVNMYMSPESNITAYSYFFTVPSGYKSEKFQTVAIYEFYGEEEKVETLTNLNVSESKRLNVSQELATNKTWLGEVVPLVYEIVNDGDEEIRDVTIIITPVVGIGYEKYEFFKRRILPKTKISLSNDMHIMKSGKLEIPVVKVEYKIGTTKYTKEIDAITIMVNASTIASPLIVGTLDTTYFTSSGNYTYMMNVENKGKQQTTVTIENNSETIKAFSEGSIKFLKDADIREEAILGYEFVGRMFYTHFSNKKMKTIDYKNNKKQEKASKNNKKSDKNNKDVKDSDLNSDSDATSENSIVKEQTKKSLFSIILIILAGVVCCVLVAGAGVYLFLKKKPPSIANADSYLTESDIKKENNDSETDIEEIKEEDIGKLDR